MLSTSKKIRIGTRASKLAQKQALEVINLLSFHIPTSQIETILITTSGDKIQDRNLAEIGGKGLFIKELEEALIQNKIDIAIHSAKDVPPFLHETTEIAAFTERLDVRDCLISQKFNSLKELPQGAIIGTSSARRKAALLRLRPDFKIVNFRGNVDSRLNKISSGEVDASILALCGLTRLDKKEAIKEIISTDLILPSGGQGSLAIQVRKNDDETIDLIKKINHLESYICIKTERAFLRELSASCVTPVGVYCYIKNEKLHLKTMLLDYDGAEIFASEFEDEVTLEAGLSLGIKAAKKTKTEAPDLFSRICG